MNRLFCNFWQWKHKKYVADVPRMETGYNANIYSDIFHGIRHFDVGPGTTATNVPRTAQNIA